MYDTESNWIEKNEVQEQETTEEIVNQNNKSETEQNVETLESIDMEIEESCTETQDKNRIYLAEDDGTTVIYGGITYAYNSEDDTYSVRKCDVNIVNAVVLSVVKEKPVIKIEREAFNECSNLISISVPESIVSGLDGMDACSFRNCNNLERIDIAEENSRYCSIDGIVFNKDKTQLYLCPKGKEGTYEIPEGTLSIEDDAFKLNLPKKLYTYCPLMP